VICLLPSQAQSHVLAAVPAIDRKAAAADTASAVGVLDTEGLVLGPFGGFQGTLVQIYVPTQRIDLGGLVHLKGIGRVLSVAGLFRPSLVAGVGPQLTLGGIQLQLAGIKDLGSSGVSLLSQHEVPVGPILLGLPNGMGGASEAVLLL